MISIKSLDKYFNKNKQNQIHVINDISLSLPDTGMIAIFGKSGCGKTTLLNTIGGLDKYDSGLIEVNGEKIDPNNTDLRNSSIGYIFQNYNLNMSESNIENVSDALRLCGLTDENLIKELSLKALKNVGLENYAYRNSNTLSGGQMQRVAIARAIVKNPKIILADEPTGNLDEANTILIMDLLRKISQDHLVLLVTHEADLVDHYCDRVIELSDGQVERVYLNDISSKYSVKDKNTIYLKELEKNEIVNNSNINLTYYGEKVNKDIDIKIINKNGKLYLNINDDDIKIIDSNSEIQLSNESFEEIQEEKKDETIFEDIVIPKEKVDGKLGRLFNLKNSIKSGYIYNFRNKKNKGSKLLRTCMILFGIILVFTIATFGVSIRNLLKVNTSYNHNVFYVESDKDKANTLLNLSSNKDSYIDSVMITDAYRYADQSIEFSCASFETFSVANYNYFGENTTDFSSNGVILDSKLCENSKLVYGKIKDLNNDEMVISKIMADDLIKNSKYSYIKDYINLIGLRTVTISYNNLGLKIVGVVDTGETAVYVNSYILACNLYNNLSLNIKLDEDLTGDTVEINCYQDESNPVDYETKYLNTLATINGLSFTISKVNIIESGWYIERNYYTISKSVQEKIINSLLYSSGTYDEVSEATYNYQKDMTYLVIHSSNPNKTEEYLKSNYSYLFELEDGTYKYINTPNTIKQDNIYSLVGGMVEKLIALVVVFALMAICIYFVMKSSLMARIKEVGIYRAIGVNKSNLIYKFLIESVVLTTLTVFIGFILSSLFVGAFEMTFPLLQQQLYYPVWLSLVLLALIYGLSILFGILPVCTLLNKTPSEILSKYDI